jgi:hypothetical protein
LTTSKSTRTIKRGAIVLITEGIGIDPAEIRANQQTITETRNAKANERLGSPETRKSGKAHSRSERYEPGSSHHGIEKFQNLSPQFSSRSQFYPFATDKP